MEEPRVFRKAYKSISEGNLGFELPMGSGWKNILLHYYFLVKSWDGRAMGWAGQGKGHLNGSPQFSSVLPVCSV